MDDAAERLRALAFASIPDASRKSFRWVRGDKEEGELSSDGDVEFQRVKKSRNRRRSANKQRAGLQSAAPPTEVPHQNLRARSQIFSGVSLLEQQRNLNVQLKDKPKDMAQTITKAAQLQLKRTFPYPILGDPKKNHNGAGNQFLIKFSDDDSESDEEPAVADVLDMDKAAQSAAPKPASLSLEINRMRKQIAAIERVKGKTLAPVNRSTKPVKPPPVKPATGSASKVVTSNGTQTPGNLDSLRKHKQCEIQQQQQQQEEQEQEQEQEQRQLKDASAGTKRKADINDDGGRKRTKLVSPLEPSSNGVTDTVTPGNRVQNTTTDLAVVTETCSRQPASIPELKSPFEQLEIEEEALDKELESAQNLRHMCEIRERLARKAYREAQEALRKANVDCQKLHQKREIFSLKVRAAEIKYFSNASDEDIMQQLLLAGTGSMAPEADAVTPEVVERNPTVSKTIPEPDRSNDRTKSFLALEEETNGAGNNLLSADPACATTHNDENEAAAETGSPPHPNDLPVPQADGSFKGKRNAEGQDEQWSSSSAGDLKSKTDGCCLEAELVSVPLKPDAVEVLMELQIEEVVTKQGSSAASSADAFMEANESNRLQKELPVFARTSLRTSTSMKPSAGRLVVFRQVSFNFGTSSLGTQEPEGKNRPEAIAPSGDYESPLKAEVHNSLDAFKPVCRYEHRGKCNNELCSFQHLKRGVRSPENSTGISKWTSCAVSVPIYRIGHYLMRESQKQQLKRPGSFETNEGSYAFLTSVSMQRPLPQDMPCIFDTLRRENEPTESFDIDCVKQNCSELLSRDSGVDSCLELALSILQFDVNLKNTNCLQNALYVLSRALEVNKSSVSLWVVYLLLFSVRDTFSKKDDLFIHAILQNKYSYELWNLVLRSRSSLTAVLDSYELAIQTLCEDGNKNTERSACILDVVLRMLYTMVMSESEVIAWIDEMVAGGTGRRWKSTSLVLKNLLPSDGCVLWVSCAYICAHGTIPEAFVSRFGCKQTVPLNVEWEASRLVNEDSRGRVLKIIETGTGWLSSADNALATQALAANYLKFLLAIGDVDSASTYGMQAVQRHSSCFQLVVLLANAQKLRSGSKSGLVVFQNALSSWPSDKPGIQALWSQYAGHALNWEGDESALLILRRSIFIEQKTQPQNQVAEDSMFSLVNLAAFEALSANIREAQQALEKALSSSEADIHCWLEYTAFRLSGTSAAQDFQSFQRTFLDILDRCHIQPQVSSKLNPLGRGFLKSIKKRKIRGFIDSLLGAAPSDHAFVNALLQTSVGPELLPKDVVDFKCLGDFVGGLLDLFPANHALAMAFCRAVQQRMKVHAVPVSTPAWAASLLLTSLQLSLPPASESCWLEAGELLQELGLGDCCESFYMSALTVYPFSAALWRRNISECKRSGKEEAAMQTAKEAGLTL